MGFSSSSSSASFSSGSGSLVDGVKQAKLRKKKPVESAAPVGSVPPSSPAEGACRSPPGMDAGPVTQSSPVVRPPCRLDLSPPCVPTGSPSMPRYHRTQSTPGMVPKGTGVSLAGSSGGKVTVAMMLDQVQSLDAVPTGPQSSRRTSNYELVAGGEASRGASGLLNSTGAGGFHRVSLTSRPGSPFQQLRGSSDFGARRPEQQCNSAGQSHPRQPSLRQNSSMVSNSTLTLASALYLDEADEFGSVASVGGGSSVVGRSEFDEDTSGSQVLPARRFTDDFSCRGGNWSSRGSVTTATASSPFPTVASSSQQALVMRHDLLIKLLAMPSDKVGGAAFETLPLQDIVFLHAIDPH